MGNMRFKVGDRVRIKSIDWYNENKDEDGDVPDNEFGILFLAENDWCCGKVFTIKEVYNCIGRYTGKNVYELYGCEGYDFTEYMIEGLITDENDGTKT